MKPSAPTKYVWIIGIVLGIIGLIGHFVFIDFITEYSFEMLAAGFILLAAGTTVKEF